MKQLDIRLVEAAWLDRLDDDHADHRTLDDERRREQGLEAFLPGLRKISIMRVGAGVFDRDRLATAGRQTDEPLADRQLDPADRVGVESDCRGQSEYLVFAIGGVDRAGVRVDPL